MSSEDMLVLSTKSLIFQRGIGKKTEEIIDPAHDIKFFEVSPNSRVLAWAKPQSVEIVDLYNMGVRHTFEAPRVQCIGFSPNATYLWFWNSPEAFTSQSISNNFKIYKLTLDSHKIGTDLLYSSQITSYNNSRLFWISNDSCFQTVNKTIKFIKDCELVFQKEIPDLITASFSTRYACIFAEKSKSESPSFIKLFKLPDISNNTFASLPLKEKKDFSYYWNFKGLFIFLLGDKVVVSCLDKVDGSSSYYGNSHVYFLGFKGEAFKVDFGDKETAIDITWFPKSDKLAIIHGGHPTTVTLYNGVGDPITKLTMGKFSRIIINPFENLMCISGIGNIKGHTEFWSLEKKKVISYVETPISNDIAWMADGVNVMFISTSPKVVVENGYRIINYRGKSICESIRVANPGCVAEDVIQIQSIIKTSSTQIQPKIDIPDEAIDMRPKKPALYVPPSYSKTNIFANSNQQKKRDRLRKNQNTHKNN